MHCCVSTCFIIATLAFLLIAYVFTLRNVHRQSSIARIATTSRPYCSAKVHGALSSNHPNLRRWPMDRESATHAKSARQAFPPDPSGRWHDPSATYEKGSNDFDTVLPISPLDSQLWHACTLGSIPGDI
jgi:hypothetical protein